MTSAKPPILLPYPRALKLKSGSFVLPAKAALHLAPDLPRDTVLLPMAELLQSTAEAAGVHLALVTGPAAHPRLAIRAAQDPAAPDHPEGYVLQISSKGIDIGYRQAEGLRAATATLRQLLRQYGRKLPLLQIRDYPDFSRRGIMLDVSRGRVPTLQALLELVQNLADFKINEFQLYTEHTFAYRNYEPVWRDWGALSGEDMLQLDQRCRELGIDLVPNQNSFGHLRYWLEYPPLKRLAEISEPYEGTGGTFLRYPTTLAPNAPGTLPFIHELYDELLPHFTSQRFNVGCDETWDLGRGQSKKLVDSKGKGQVYVDFLLQIHKEVTARGKQMMFWGDIIMNHPELLAQLPKDIIALNWGYEANHPFEREAGLFEASKMPFYVCPGTSTWMTLLGRHDNAFANLRLSAEAGLKHGAIGYLNTDWGDGGHPQPLAVSYVPYLVGASLSWCAKTHDENLLAPVLSRDVYHDPTQRIAGAAIAMGFAHRKFNYYLPNITPYGTVIAAPIPKTRELMNRDGLKLYARIKPKNILAAREELEKQRAVLYQSKPVTFAGELFAAELDMAARMASQSCDIMLWQQALAAGKQAGARQLAKKGIAALQELDHDFRAYWPVR
ncbi:MAG TPA: glycoside hydrolase family 20 zincin-like fold domain-containing protein, partial [Clostridia bacterium]|nr:glycoside hydrolase family 20 zincin-like fold domain-containing protein [Clostridia bacterium]